MVEKTQRDTTSPISVHVMHTVQLKAEQLDKESCIINKFKLGIKITYEVQE
jgi:hypothetical protein